MGRSRVEKGSADSGTCGRKKTAEGPDWELATLWVSLAHSESYQRRSTPRTNSALVR